jgi:hypothetical protein
MPDDIPTSLGNTVRLKEELNTLDEVLDMYKPEGYYVHAYNLSIKNYLRSIGQTKFDNLMCMAFHIMQSIKLANDRYQISGQEYDLVIRYRFDYGIKIKFEDYDLNKINIPDEHGYKGYQDMFAFGNMKVMSLLGLWFRYLQDVESCRPSNWAATNSPGKPWHPETTYRRYVDQLNVPIGLIKGLDIVYPWCDKKQIEAFYD